MICYFSFSGLMFWLFNSAFWQCIKFRNMWKRNIYILYILYTCILVYNWTLPFVGGSTWHSEFCTVPLYMFNSILDPKEFPRQALPVSIMNLVQKGMPSGVIKRGNSTSPHRNRSFAQLWTFIYRGFSITSFDYQRVLQKIMLVVVEVNMKKEPAKLQQKSFIVANVGTANQESAWIW